MNRLVEIFTLLDGYFVSSVESSENIRPLKKIPVKTVRFSNEWFVFYYT